jgi:hypothetical protein
MVASGGDDDLDPLARPLRLRQLPWPGKLGLGECVSSQAIPRQESFRRVGVVGRLKIRAAVRPRMLRYSARIHIAQPNQSDELHQNPFSSPCCLLVADRLPDL